MLSCTHITCFLLSNRIHIFFSIFPSFSDVFSAKLDGHGTGLFSLVTKNERYNYDSSPPRQQHNNDSSTSSPTSKSPHEKHMLQQFASRKKTWVLKSLEPLDILHDWLNVLVQCKNHRKRILHASNNRWSWRRNTVVNFWKELCTLLLVGVND